jgi:hypothetical protein
MARVRTKPAKQATGDAEAGVPIEQCLLVQDEIWRVVSEAASNGVRLSLSGVAQKIASAFPAAGLTLQNVADALVYAAIEYGVAFEPRPKPVRQPTVRNVPSIDVPGLLAFVGRRRKSQGGERQSRPTFAGLPIPAT